MFTAKSGQMPEKCIEIAAYVEVGLELIRIRQCAIAVPVMTESSFRATILRRKGRTVVGHSDRIRVIWALLALLDQIRIQTALSLRIAYQDTMIRRAP